MALFRLTEQEEKSFLSVNRHTVLKGEIKLARFSDSSKGVKGVRGAFWMYASEIKEVLLGISGNRSGGLRLIREISDRWAICDDWGDLQLAWVMTIPPGRELQAYWGFARFQPKTSVETQKATGRTTPNYYDGGSIQLVTRIGHQERRWIQGPFHTLQLCEKHL